MFFRATVLSKILNEQTSLETRQEIQRAYDRMRQILSNKSDILIEHSNKMSKSQVNREAEKKQIVDRLLKIFEKKMEMSENFDRTEEEELLSLGLKEKVWIWFRSKARIRLIVGTNIFQLRYHHGPVHCWKILFYLCGEAVVRQIKLHDCSSLCLQL